MNIVIQEELKKYLSEHKHDTLTLKLVHNDYSTGNIYTHNPKISYSPPHDLDGYTEYQVDDIKVYIANDVVPAGEKLEFIHEKLLGVHGCHVKGVKLDHITTM